MFRLLGFLIGSISSIVIILLLVGMPEFHLSDAETDQQRFDAAIEKLREKQAEFEDVTGKLSDDVARVAEAVEDNVEIVAEKLAAGQEPDPVSAQSAPMPANPPPMQEPVAIASNLDPAGGNPQAMSEAQWYSFWNPFRSEIAANGFVAQLERVTGIDYRVVKVKSGVYEVAFPYADDGERQTKLALISEATGLDLPDS